MLDDDTLVRVAQRIRNIRNEKGLTLQQLSERAKISKGLLSKIENNRTVPSLPVFINIVQNLEVGLRDFFEDIHLLNGKDYIVIRKENYKKLTKENRIGFTYDHILSQSMSNYVMNAVLLTIDADANGKPATTDGFEFKYILSGSCSYQINNELIELNEGDSIYIDGRKPHLPINLSGSSVKMLVVYFLTNS